MPAGSLSYLYVLQQAVGSGDAYGSAQHPMSLYPAVLNTLNVASFLPLLGPARVVKYNGNVINF